MKRIRLINLILIMFCCCNMLAQNITVTGQVVDVTSEPIIGASVVVKGTTNGTITDFDGNFTLSVQKGETLHISYIGYVAQDVKVMGNQPVKVVMAEDTETLDEVVVVGTSMKKSDLTGAVASVSSKVLEEKPVTNVNQALQGRVAGVFISQPTRPTDDASIKIRGINTINGSTDPIYVIDGMVMDNSAYVYPDCNYWEFDCGSRACDSWFGQGCSFSGYDFLVPTPFAYKTVEEGGIWEDGDLRKEEALRYDFTYYTNKYSEDGTFEYVTPDLSKTQWTGTTDELEPHIKKYEDYRTDILSGLGINNMWNSGKNFSMIRYADVLLLHAECLNELGQTSEAVQIVNNQIRTRAWGGNLPEDKKWNSGMSKDEFRDKVMDERLRELCFEGWRRIDLLRTNKFVELIKERNRWAKESGTIQDFHKRYPIPDTEIKTNDAFGPEDQNPGYSK